MKLLVKILSFAVLGLIILNEAQFVLTAVSDRIGQMDERRVEMGEAESAGEERADDIREEMEKIFSVHQPVLWLTASGSAGNYFVYKISMKPNIHLDIVSPPPQFLCLLSLKQNRFFDSETSRPVPSKLYSS
jgi:hypothetical protein